MSDSVVLSEFSYSENSVLDDILALRRTWLRSVSFFSPLFFSHSFCPPSPHIAALHSLLWQQEYKLYQETERKESKKKITEKRSYITFAFSTFGGRFCLARREWTLVGAASWPNSNIKIKEPKLLSCHCWCRRGKRSMRKRFARDEKVKRNGAQERNFFHFIV